MKEMTEIVEFVKEVEKYPCIYNHTCPEYSCRSETKRAWQAIATKFESNEHGCKDKWRKIRIAFSRSLKIMKTGNASMRPYYLYEHLTYLLPFLRGNEDQMQPASPVTSEEDCHEVAVYEVNPLITKTENFSDTEEFNRSNNNHKMLNVFINEPTYEKQAESNQKMEDVKVKKRRTEENIEDNPRKMFLLSILPDVESFSDAEMRSFRRGVIGCIDDIIENRVHKVQGRKE